MSETTGQPDPQQTPPEGQKTPDIAEALRDLGEQIEKTMQAVMSSARTREIQNEILSGMREMGTNIRSAVDKVKEDPRMQEFAERGQRAVHDVQEKAQETPMLRDAQETLARMIAQASVQLGEFAERMRASAQNTPPASQDIPIDDESDKPGSDPTTGPTTRL